jgi:hypothetical protein
MLSGTTGHHPGAGRKQTLPVRTIDVNSVGQEGPEAMTSGWSRLHRKPQITTPRPLNSVAIGWPRPKSGFAEFCFGKAVLRNMLPPPNITPMW